MIIEKLEKRMKVAETDEGEELQAQVDDLVRLIEAYRNGAVAENHQS
jgi:fructose-1,6-bisphosphatase-3